MTEKLFARMGRSPRRLHYCKSEAKILASMTKKLAHRTHRGAALFDESLYDAWAAINSGKCRVARKRLVRMVKAHPRVFLTMRDRLEREGYVKVPGRDLARIWAER
jgi:hypothetical protein